MPHYPGRILSQVLLCALAALGMGNGSLRAAEGEPLEPVRLQLKWTHQFQFAGYYAAAAKGFYRDAGLSVRMMEAVPEKDPVRAVLDGEAEFGVGNSDLLLMRASGEPVVVLAAIFQHSPLLLVVRAASGVTDPQGLQDREMMMIDSEKAELFAFLKHEGLDINRLRVRPHTLRLSDFVEGKVDAMSAYATDELFELQQMGFDYYAFSARAGGIDFYGDNLFTTEKEIREHPDTVRRFRDASLKGWEYALENPEEIIDLIRREFPDRLSREHLVFEAARTAELMHPGIIEVGHMNPGRWRHIADTYAEFGMMPADYNLAGFIYDPNPVPDMSWAYWTLGILGAVAIAATGWLLPLMRLNRKLAEAKTSAETANEAKGRYLNFLSHEIRTPLNGIVGVMDEVKAGNLQPASRRHVELAEQAARDLLQLVDNILDHSRIEADALSVDNSPVAVADLIGGLMDLFRAAGGSRGLILRHRIDADVPTAIVTDPLRLRQILANLISNALKFTSAGEIDIEVSAESIDQNRRRIRFRVIDTGIGIAPEMAKRLFQPFTQADPSVARRYGGSGLGLSISQRLAALLGGRITVESTPGKGSTFTLEIVAGIPSEHSASES